MDLFELYLLLKGGGSGGGNSTNYNAIIQALNTEFGFEFDSTTPIEDIIATIENIITFEDWSDYDTSEDWTSNEGGSE